MAPELGQGVYTLSEVARFAEMHPSTVRSWFRGRSDGTGRGPLLRSDFEGAGGDFAVSFLDLVDCYVAGRFRSAGVTMPTVRAAYFELATDLRTSHPFAHGCLYTDGRRILVNVAGRVRDDLLYDAVSKQILFEQLQRVLKRIEYRPDNYLAARWNRARGVLIDPGINFGSPVIKSTGISTVIVARQYLANRRDAKLVADLFDLNESDIENALEFEASIGRIAA